MDDIKFVLIAVGVVALFVALGFIQRLANRGIDKASNKIEQKVKKGAYAEEQQLFGTAKHYRTTATVQQIYQQLEIYVQREKEDRKWNIMTGNNQYGIWMVEAQTGKWMKYQIIAKGSFDTADAIIQFSSEGGTTQGKFCFTSYNKSGSHGIIGCLEYMNDLARGVEQAFKAADPNVEIRESQQKFG